MDYTTRRPWGRPVICVRGDPVEIAFLELDEPVRLDPEQLCVLVQQLGPAAAESVVSRAMEELAVRLGDLPGLAGAQRYDDLACRARSLVGIAEQIGLTGFARVARDVSISAERCDVPALMATLARLDRVADRALLAVWDLRDMQI